MKSLLVGVGLLLIVSLPASAGDLTLEFRDGYVTVRAHDVPLREILAEWARKGQTRIVNGEKVTTALVTIELTRVPEKQALETLLRSVSGYMVATRATYVPNLSTYDRIMVLPTSTAAAPAAAAARPVQQPFGMPSPNPAMAQMPSMLADPDEIDSPNPPGVPIFPVPDGVNPIGDPNMSPNPNGNPTFMPVPGGLQPQPIPEGQSPIRPYASPNDPNTAPPADTSPFSPSPLKPGIITSPSPGQLPSSSQKPPQ